MMRRGAWLGLTWLAIACAQHTPPEQAATGGPAKSRLSMGATRVDGRLDPDHVQRTARAEYRGLQGCYENSPALAERAAGRVAVRFVVGPDGKVSQAEIDPTSTLADGRVTGCVLSVFRGLSFAAPEGGGTATVLYMMDFGPV